MAALHERIHEHSFRIRPPHRRGYVSFGRAHRSDWPRNCRTAVRGTSSHWRHNCRTPGIGETSSRRTSPGQTARGPRARRRNSPRRKRMCLGRFRLGSIVRCGEAGLGNAGVVPRSLGNWQRRVIVVEGLVRTVRHGEDAAGRLGFAADNWNVVCSPGVAAAPAEEIRPVVSVCVWDGFDWDQLSNAERQAWEALGWSRTLWETDNSTGASSSSRTWSDLSDTERNAAERLGFDADNWNVVCPPVLPGPDEV